MKHKQKAFTLVELLVVVLIIGILSAIAIPMYQGAVDKSHWSTMLPASKAIKDAEEAFKMTNGEYSDTMEHLDVQINNDDLTFTLNTPNNLADPNVIRVTTSKLDNVRLASYLDASPKFAGQLHCEAKTGDERASRLCGKLLNGEEIGRTEDSYSRYLLDQAITKEICGDAQRFWSSKKTYCYETEKDRCTANDMPYNENGIWYANVVPFCGYYGGNDKELDEGGVCYGGFDSCKNSKFNNGAICVAAGQGACGAGSEYSNGSVCVGQKTRYPCNNSTFDNSLCISTMGDGGGCRGSTFNNGSVCYATDSVPYYGGWGCAGVTYNDTSCCCGGATCPNEHRCSDSQCSSIEQQVAQINSQVAALTKP